MNKEVYTHLNKLTLLLGMFLSIPKTKKQDGDAASTKRSKSVLSRKQNMEKVQFHSMNSIIVVQLKLMNTFLYNYYNLNWCHNLLNLIRNLFNLNCNYIFYINNLLMNF